MINQKIFEIKFTCICLTGLCRTDLINSQAPIDSIKDFVPLLKAETRLLYPSQENPLNFGAPSNNKTDLLDSFVFLAVKPQK